MKKLLLVYIILNLISCNKNHMMNDITQPENLLDYSNEKISLPLTDMNSLNEIETHIEKDIPNKAQIYCNYNKLCDQARQIFREKDIEIEEIKNNESETYIALIYNRIIAKDCQGDNIHNSLGCANSVNMIQMIGNYKQFVKPNIIDPYDASNASKIYENYQTK